MALGGPAIFGGNTVPARPAPATEAPTLTIDALTVFGGLQVGGRDDQADEARAAGAAPGEAAMAVKRTAASSALPVDAG